MSIKEELEVEVRKIFKEQWSKRSGREVPDETSLTLDNDAVEIRATVLYADLSGSTKMVDTKRPEFAGEVYKTFLRCSAKIIRAEGGAITAYDGDRIMAVFVGDWKNTSAVTAGLRINYAVKNIINPALKNQYPDSPFVVRHVVGIDTSDVMAAKIGVRGANDLVWIGRAANYAAKLTELDADYPTWITHTVYKEMDESKKTYNGNAVWEERVWTSMNNFSIYRSNWTWGF